MFCGFVFDPSRMTLVSPMVPPTKPFWPGNAGVRTFADDPVVFAAVRFAPSEIVMVVNFFLNFRPKNSCDTLTDPIAAA